MKKIIISSIFLVAVLVSFFDLAAYDVEDAIAAFEKKIALNPISINGNPYHDSSQLPDYSEDDVCAIQYQDDGMHYYLASFENEEAAESNGHIVTHKTSCGTCSTLQDLAVYLKYPDLTTPVRKCGIKSMSKSWTMSCLRKLGFTEECAETWYYNTKNTADACFWVCLKSWIKNEPSNREDGSLNACLACDEEKSGPVFKRTAGRTRRNSGIHSSIERPDDEVYPIEHDYY